MSKRCGITNNMEEYYIETLIEVATERTILI